MRKMNVFYLIREAYLEPSEHLRWSFFAKIVKGLGVSYSRKKKSSAVVVRLGSKSKYYFRPHNKLNS